MKCIILDFKLDPMQILIPGKSGVAPALGQAFIKVKLDFHNNPYEYTLLPREYAINSFSDTMRYCTAENFFRAVIFKNYKELNRETPLAEKVDWCEEYTEFCLEYYSDLFAEYRASTATQTDLASDGINGERLHLLAKGEKSVTDYSPYQQRNSIFHSWPINWETRESIQEIAQNKGLFVVTKPLAEQQPSRGCFLL